MGKKELDGVRHGWLEFMQNWGGTFSRPPPDEWRGRVGMEGWRRGRRAHRAFLEFVEVARRIVVVDEYLSSYGYPLCPGVGVDLGRIGQTDIEIAWRGEQGP